jgi:ATP adenylyltransferase/5',5'''-P-1,P-4-tetraphosphate phosphorylase II
MENGKSNKILHKQELNAFFQTQLAEWPLSAQNYEALKKVQTKDFAFDGFKVQVQFNPARIQSSAAKIDTKSIRERKCFLCQANRPLEQRMVPFGDEYQILVNPYPIFPRHLTIPSIGHVEQLISGRYGDMLDLAETLDDFVVFYNGPKCGASAPDHVHFQAGSKGFLPLEKDVRTVSRKVILPDEKTLFYSLENYLRAVFVMESSDKKSMLNLFDRFYTLLKIGKGEKEPMLNIVSWYEDRKWISCIFPREIHRPYCFFAEGEQNLLISPASVDMGGVFIAPREKDFEKIGKKDVEAILKEVCINFSRQIDIIRNYINYD